MQINITLFLGWLHVAIQGSSLFHGRTPHSPPNPQPKHWYVGFSLKYILASIVAHFSSGRHTLRPCAGARHVTSQESKELGPALEEYEEPLEHLVRAP